MVRCQEHPIDRSEAPWDWLGENIKAMAGVLSANFSPIAKAMEEADPLMLAEMEQSERRFLRKERKREEDLARLRENMERMARERHLREQRAEEAKRAADAKKAAALKTDRAAQAPVAERLPLPTVPVLRVPVPVRVIVLVLSPALRVMMPPPSRITSPAMTMLPPAEAKRLSTCIHVCLSN